MCGVRREEVFELLIGAKKPVEYKTPIERLKQIVEAQNLYAQGSKREEALILAAEFYQGCLDKMEWEAVSELSYQFIERSRQVFDDELTITRMRDNFRKQMNKKRR